jgi:threonine dehydratase
MDWRGEIEAAGQRVAGHVRVTPVVTMDVPGVGPVELKLEQMQHTGSFKARGAFNALLSAKVPAAGVVAASGGNHGAAVAFAAARLGIPATIYVPDFAGPAKIGLIRAQGANCVVVNGLYADAAAAAAEHVERTGAMQVHPYDQPATVAGQGSLMREWEAQGLQADTVLIAVGGGGLIAGALGWLGGRRRVVAVEPELAPTLNRALQEGPQTRVTVGGIAANALGASQIGSICYGLSQGAVTSVLVEEAAIEAGQRALWQGLRQLVEPAGAAALSALISGRYVPEKGERVAVLVCGANIAPDPFG